MPAGAPTRTATPRMRTSIRHASRSRCASPRSILDVLRQRQLTIYSDMLVGDYRRLRDQIEARAQAGRISGRCRADQGKPDPGGNAPPLCLRRIGASAEYRFTRITGRPRGPTFRDWPANGDQQTLLDAARERNPQLQAALRRVKARTEDIGVARGNPCRASISN